MRASKDSHRISVRDVQYRWRTTGNDGWISISIWPLDAPGPQIHGTFGYHETWIDNTDGSRSSGDDQIIVTNRIILRIIEHSLTVHGYDPRVKGKQLNLWRLDDVIQWDDAIRASN